MGTDRWEPRQHLRFADERTQPVRNRAASIIADLTLDEKIAQMHGTTPVLKLAFDAVVLRHYNRRPYPAAGVTRHSVPPVRFTDGPRGVTSGHCTCFPVAMARAATWDLSLQEEVGEAMGRECRAVGANCFGGVCVNLLHHPAGGRAQESYGEDMHLTGEMGAALVRGVQRHNVMACVKHFALNNIEDTRFVVDVEIDPRTLHEVYLPHFKRCIDEGAAVVMGAYNKVGGEHCCENRFLLSRILKGWWGFTGFTMSDFTFAVHDAERAANAGLDVEMSSGSHFNRRTLKRLVRSGRVKPERIDGAALRVVDTTLRFAATKDLQKYDSSVVAGPAHVELARRCAEASVVLLKNDFAPLPIGPGIRRVAVVGRMAERANTGDRGSSRVHPPYVITPLDGIAAAAKRHGATVAYTSGGSLKDARRAALGADVVVAVVGNDHADEGEGGFAFLRVGGDRTTLSLHRHDVELITTVAEVNPRTVVTLIGGSAITVDQWCDSVPAIVMAWYGGMEGGAALARVLFGEAEPGGRLPFAVPHHESDLPPFDHASDKVVYGRYHGYFHLDRAGTPPRYPFGFGLSYTTFAFGELAVGRSDAAISAAVTVTNTGDRHGSAVVQCYVGWLDSAVERPVRSLGAFGKVRLEPGESRRVDLSVPLASLAYFEPSGDGAGRPEATGCAGAGSLGPGRASPTGPPGRWVVEDIGYRIFVGPWNDESVLLSAVV